MIEIPEELNLESYKELLEFERDHEFFKKQRRLIIEQKKDKSNEWYLNFIRPLVSSSSIHSLIKYLYPEGVPKNSRILQIGCNYGPFLKYLSEKSKKEGLNLELTGVDMDSEAVQFGREVGGLDLRVMDALNMDGIESESKDIVISDNFLDETYSAFRDRERHILDEDRFNVALSETHRVLSPGGVLLGYAGILSSTRLETIGYDVQEYSIPSNGRIRPYDLLFKAEKIKN